MAALVLALGIAGFLLVALADAVQVRGWNRAAGVASSIGYASVASAIVFLTISDAPAETSYAALLPELLAVTVFALLLFYSVVIEIPLRRRPRGAQRGLYTAGTYALVRHPGFLWFSLMWASIMVIFQNGEAITVGAVMVLCDLLLVAVEDRYFFPRIFSDYEEYKRRVPFLLPRFRVR